MSVKRESFWERHPASVLEIRTAVNSVPARVRFSYTSERKKEEKERKKEEKGRKKVQVNRLYAGSYSIKS